MGTCDPCGALCATPVCAEASRCSCCGKLFGEQAVRDLGMASYCLTREQGVFALKDLTVAFLVFI